MLDEKKLLATAANMAAFIGRAGHFTTADLLKKMGEKATSTSMLRDAGALLLAAGWRTQVTRRPDKKGVTRVIKAWMAPPVISAGEREQIERHAGAFAKDLRRDVPYVPDQPSDSTTRDALDAEALAELVRRANETNEGLVREIEEQREVIRTIREFAYEMAGRWSSALCAGGIIDVYRVERRSDEEINRLGAKVEAVRARRRGGPTAAREAL